MNALVIGGTGPTGHFIVNGLRARGYGVTLFHSGRHERAEIPPEVEQYGCEVCYRLDRILYEVDVVNMLRVQQERITS